MLNKVAVIEKNMKKGVFTVTLGGVLVVFGTLLIQPLLAGVGFILLGVELNKRELSLASIPLLLAFMSALTGLVLRIPLVSLILCYIFVVATGYCIYRAFKGEEPSIAKLSLVGSLTLIVVIGYVLLLIASLKILKWGYITIYKRDLLSSMSQWQS